jgi:hypothetical protein
MQGESSSYTPLQGGYLKGSFIKTATKAVYAMWDDIHAGRFNSLAGIYSVGGRAKGKSVKFDLCSLGREEKLTSRPVHVPELFNVVFDSCYLQLFNTY